MSVQSGHMRKSLYNYLCAADRVLSHSMDRNCYLLSTLIANARCQVQNYVQIIKMVTMKIAFCSPSVWCMRYMAVIEVITGKLNFFFLSFFSLLEIKCRAGGQPAQCKFPPSDNRQANSIVNVSPLDQCQDPGWTMMLFTKGSAVHWLVIALEPLNFQCH